MANEYPTLNGIAPSWADVEIPIAISGGETVQTSDILAINHSNSIEIGVVRGPGGKKRKRTRGQGTPEAGMTMTIEGWRLYRRALVAKATELGYPDPDSLEGYSLVSSNILIQHTPPGESAIYTTTLEGVRVIGVSESHAEGTDAAQTELTLDVMKIRQS